MKKLLKKLADHKTRRMIRIVLRKADSSLLAAIGPNYTGVFADSKMVDELVGWVDSSGRSCRLVFERQLMTDHSDMIRMLIDHGAEVFITDAPLPAYFFVGDKQVVVYHKMMGSNDGKASVQQKAADSAKELAEVFEALVDAAGFEIVDDRRGGDQS